MARYKYDGTFKDGNGRVVGTATTSDGIAGTISVYLAGTTTAASVYTASAGGVAVNSVSTDTHGYFYFWVDDTDYAVTQRFKITLSHADFESKSYDNIRILNHLDAVTATAAEVSQYALTVTMADISTAGSVWVVAPHAGTIAAIYSVINGAIITVNAGITTEIAGAAVTGGAITIAFTGSAAGVVDSCTPTAANTVTAGQAIEIITDGASTNTVIATFTILITR